MQPKIFHANDHDIDRTLIDPDAIAVIHRLRSSGYQAYLVGGSVRDLLIKKKPKDFDISTSAKPEEIKRLFQRNCMIIGKRFRLAHIRFKHNIIEVSTFRSGDNEDDDLIVRDNCWGTPEQDVIRRDFTINGLFYDPEAHTVIDYAGGWDDIHKHTLRTIGDPIVRFRQDPVRMIRLLKFQARFDFTIDKKTQDALPRCLEEILKSAPARILEEMLRMLESGAAAPFFKLMTKSGMLELLFPCLSYFLEGQFGAETYSYLEAVDAIHFHNSKKPINRSVLTACLLYSILERELEVKYLKNNHIPTYGEIVTLASSLIHGVVSSSFAQFPKRLMMEAHYILTTQYRLTPLDNKHHHRPKLFHHKEFDLALMFFKIRSIMNPHLLDEYNHWLHAYQNQHS